MRYDNTNSENVKSEKDNLRFSVSGDRTDFNGNERNGFVESIDRDGLPDPIITQKGAAGRFSALPAATTIPQTSENANNFRFSVSGDGTDFNGNERNGTELNGQKLDEDYFAALERVLSKPEKIKISVKTLPLLGLMRKMEIFSVLK